MKAKHRNLFKKLLLLIALLSSVPSQAQIGSPFQISGEMATFGDVDRRYQISANGQRVVYIANQDVDGVDELYSVPISGGIPVKLNAVLTGDEDVTRFRISPHSQRVVYKAGRTIPFVSELYGVSITGGTPVQINANLPVGSRLDTFSLSADGKFVVYRADQDVFDEFEVVANDLIQIIGNDEFCIPIKASNGNVAVICF